MAKHIIIHSAKRMMHCTTVFFRYAIIPVDGSEIRRGSPVGCFGSLSGYLYLPLFYDGFCTSHVVTSPDFRTEAPGDHGFHGFPTNAPWKKSPILHCHQFSSCILKAIPIRSKLNNLKHLPKVLDSSVKHHPCSFFQLTNRPNPRCPSYEDSRLS